MYLQSEEKPSWFFLLVRCLTCWISRFKISVFSSVFSHIEAIWVGSTMKWKKQKVWAHSSEYEYNLATYYWHDPRRVHVTIPSLKFPICKMGTMMPKEVTLNGGKSTRCEDPGLEISACSLAMWPQKRDLGDFPGGPVVKTLCSQCGVPGFDPWSGN